MEQYAAYLRKSRYDHDYAELSVEETLKRHEAILTNLANARGYHIAKTFHEVVSGESIAARPQIQALLEEVNTGLYAGVLVVDLERLARGNSADQAYISQVFQFSSTKIVTPQKVYDPNNEFDQEYFEFGLFMSRREYKTITRRLVRGREQSAVEGKYTGSIPPYGYRRQKLIGEKGYTLEAEPEEASVVQQIFALYLQNVGTKRIANQLNDMGIPTRRGGLWTYSCITPIINNPVYMGKIKRGFCRQIRRMENGQVKKHIQHMKDPNAYTLYDGMHPPLIDEETFWRAQEIRIERQPRPRVKDDHELKNSFAGLLYCGCCGLRVGRTVMSEKRGATPRLRCVNLRNCHNGTADYALVEREIISALRTWLDGYKVKVTSIGFAEDIANGRAMLERLEQDTDKIKAQMDNAYDLVEQGVYTLDFFKTRREKLQMSMDALNAKKDVLQKKIERLESNESLESNLIPHTESLLESYDQMSVTERNQLLKAILQKIEYRKEADGKITIDLFPKLPQLDSSVGII